MTIFDKWVLELFAEMKFSTFYIEFIFVLGALVTRLLLAITQPVQRFSEKKLDFLKLPKFVYSKTNF